MSNIAPKKRRRHTLRKPKHEHAWSLRDSYDFRRQSTWTMPSDMFLPLFPYCMEEEIRVGEYWYKDKFTRFLLVVICLKGSIMFRFDDHDAVLTRGHVLIVPQGVGYLLKNVDSTSSHKVVIEFIGNNLMSDMETLGLNRILMLKVREYQKLADEIREIGDLMHDRNREDVPLAVGLSYRLCTELSMLIAQSDATNTRLQRAQMLLESNFEKKLTVAMLAGELNCSTSFLNKLFRTQLNTTPMQYRLEKKMACARYLLCSTSLAVKEIAFKLGYCDPFYFSNEFRRLTGESPSAARKQKALI